MTQVEQAERRKAIADARAKGENIADLARRFQLSRSTIAIAIGRESITPAEAIARTKRHPFDVLAKLLAPGKTTDAQVARECGLTRERVRQLKQHARRLGLL